MERGLVFTVNFLDNISIKKKLPAIIVICAIVSSLTILALSYFRAEHGLILAQSEKLEALRESRKKELSDYLRAIEEDMVTVAANPFTLQALQAYDIGWKALGGDQTEKLQKLYITDNPNPTGQKEKLDSASDGSAYSAAHAQFHPWFRSLLKARDYYDIFLFNADGDLVYTVFKELDYATNLNRGRWKDTDLGNAFRAALQSGRAGARFFFDFKPYAPSADAPASFIDPDYGWKRQGRRRTRLSDADRTHQQYHAGKCRHG